jgi:hypothetical protein
MFPPRRKSFSVDDFPKLAGILQRMKIRAERKRERGGGKGS